MTSPRKAVWTTRIFSGSTSGFIHPLLFGMDTLPCVLPSAVHPQPVVGVKTDIPFEQRGVAPRQLDDVFLGGFGKVCHRYFLEDYLVRTVRPPDHEPHLKGRPVAECERRRTLVRRHAAAEEIHKH